MIAAIVLVTFVDVLALPSSVFSQGISPAVTPSGIATPIATSTPAAPPDVTSKEEGKVGSHFAYQAHERRATGRSCHSNPGGERNPGEHSQQQWCGARNSLVGPLALSLRPEVGTHLLEGDLDAPAHRMRWKCCRQRRLAWYLAAQEWIL